MYAQNSRDCLIVAAVGNDGTSAGASYPARYAGVLGVAATTPSDTRASFSNYGVGIDIAAPGVDILSTTWPGSGTGLNSGTSMACPHVAGVAALVRTAQPGLTQSEVAARLSSTARDLGTAGYDSYFGYGLVRADLALGVVAPGTDDNIPGIALPSSPVAGAVSDASDLDDVYKVYLNAGQQLSTSLTGAVGTDFDLYLFSPTATDVFASTPVGSSTGSSYPEQVIYTASSSGYHYIDVYAYSGSGTYTLTWSISTSVPPAVTFTRFSGTDRFGTAILASRGAFASGECAALIIATGMNYPDALSGAGLAGAANAPILLVSGDVLKADVKAEIQRVTQGQANFKVYILGSTAAVTTKMETSIKAALTGESVERFPGANRYATAQLVAARVKSLQGASFDTKAILVPGLDYVDGLLVGPAAFSAKAPILLVGTTADTALINTLKSLGTTELVVLGTTARIPVAVETSLKAAIPGLVTTRASSLADTHARSAAAAEYFATPANGFGLTWTGIGIATAEKFPDGLGAGCVEGKLKTSLLLTKTASLPSAVSTKIAAHAAAVSGAVETSARNLLE